MDKIYKIKEKGVLCKITEKVLILYIFCNCNAVFSCCLLYVYFVLGIHLEIIILGVVQKLFQLHQLILMYMMMQINL